MGIKLKIGKNKLLKSKNSIYLMPNGLLAIKFLLKNRLLLSSGRLWFMYNQRDGGFSQTQSLMTLTFL